MPLKDHLKKACKFLKISKYLKENPQNSLCFKNGVPACLKWLNLFFQHIKLKSQSPLNQNT